MWDLSYQGNSFRCDKLELVSYKLQRQNNDLSMINWNRLVILISYDHAVSWLLNTFKSVYLTWTVSAFLAELLMTRMNTYLDKPASVKNMLYIWTFRKGHITQSITLNYFTKSIIIFLINLKLHLHWMKWQLFIFIIKVRNIWHRELACTRNHMSFRWKGEQLSKTTQWIPPIQMQQRWGYKCASIITTDAVTKIFMNKAMKKWNQHICL